MKTSALFLFVIALIFCLHPLSAQSEKGFNYQAVARDNAGAILSNTAVNLRFQIRESTPGGTLVYQEKHTPTTNVFGLLQVSIGKGLVESGDFSTISWSGNDFFLLVELNGNSVDSTLFEAVPYSKVATSMELSNLTDVDGTAPALNQVLTWDGTQWVPGNATTYSAGSGISITGGTISNTAPDQTVSLNSGGATTVSGTYPNFTITSTDNVNDADSDPANELQSLSLSGNTLSLSPSGGSVSLTSFSSPWSASGSNLFYNSGNVGIGDNTPIATLTVGNGDKLQVHGADGDIVFSDDEGSLRFANSIGTNAPMIHMFQSGTNNSTRMLLAHSPSFPTWGIRYNDTTDAFTWIGDNIPVMQVQLAGQQRVGVGTESPEAKLHVSTNSATGFGQLKLTETQFDYSRITLNNNIHSNYWDIAARTDTNLANAQFNIYHSNVGDIFSVNARGRVGINEASPAYTMEINGNQSTRIINAYNDLPATTSTTYNYGLRVGLSQAANTGFPRLYNVYAISTDADAYLTYGLYAYATGASNNNYGVYAYAPTSSGYAGYFSGNVYCTGSYQPSDSRLKSGIAPLGKGLEAVMQLQPKTYLYDREEFAFMNLPQGEQYGFLAQDLELALPHLVNRAFQAYDEALSDTPEGQGFEFKAINYTGLIPVMVSAIQEQQALIGQQEAKIQSLEERLEKLEKMVEGRR